MMMNRIRNPTQDEVGFVWNNLKRELRMSSINI